MGEGLTIIAHSFSLIGLVLVGLTLKLGAFMFLYFVAANCLYRFSIISFD